MSPVRWRALYAFFATVLSLASAQRSIASEFCAVSNFGASGPCFQSLQMCESWVRNTGGACALMNTSSSAPAASSSAEVSAFVSILALLAAEDRQAEAERSRREAAERERERAAAQARREREAVIALEVARQEKRQNALNRLPEFGAVCSDLGFKTGSTPYSDCVMELYRRARGN
jgi:hypothetical protein